jgi:hypothetical protein
MSQKEVIANHLTCKDPWLARTWRPAAFWIYACICIFDFVIMPAWYQINYYDLSRKEALFSSLQYNERAIEALTVLLNRNPWTPLTLEAGGTFHVAFGAILGATAWTRGKEREERTRQLGQALQSKNVDASMKPDNPD